jgi:hypothetical protein
MHERSADPDGAISSPWLMPPSHTSLYFVPTNRPSFSANQPMPRSGDIIASHRLKIGVVEGDN